MASCGLSGESKRTLSFCCYRHGAEIIRQILLRRLGTRREIPPPVPAGVDLCREIRPGVPGLKIWHREEPLSGLCESLLCRQIPPGVPKSPWIRREKPLSVPVGCWALVHTATLRGAGRRGVVRLPAFLGKDAQRRVQVAGFLDAQECAAVQLPVYLGTGSRCLVHRSVFLGEHMQAAVQRPAFLGTVRSFPAQQRDGNAVSYLHVAAANKSAHSPDEK